MNINDVIQDKFIRLYNRCAYIDIDIDTDSIFIEEIMTCLLPDSLYRNNFKHIMQSIFKIKPDKPIIFEDIYGNYESPYISRLIEKMYYKLTGNTHQYIDMNWSTSTIDINKRINESIKEAKHQIPRYVIIINTYDYEKIITAYIKIGVNIFIIPKKSAKSKYNYSADIKHDDIFNSANELFIPFMKWSVT